MPQPTKKTSAAGQATPRGPAAVTPTAARKTVGGRGPSGPPPRPRYTAVPRTTDELVANVAALRELVISSLTFTTERLQEAIDDAVQRRRTTRRDAEELLAALVRAGRAQTDTLFAELEGLVQRGAGSSDAVLRRVDRARRVGAGTFPIDGYDELTVAQITPQLRDLTAAELRTVSDHERRHAGRRTVLAAIERRLARVTA